jgi:UDP-N-acetylmuramyl pentapeptide phosphotransferase/UDP-N-acetylglucosamine-1-phosphate transferase
MQATLAGPILAPALAFALSFALLRLLLSPSAQRWFLDHPNQRSLHSSPIPRTGGLAIVPAVVLGLLLAGGARLPAVLAAALMLLSVLDDWRHLPALVRLLGHLAAALAFVLLALPGQGIGWLLLLAIAVGWMTNLYNFMDGADGLAGGMALVGFSVYGLSAWLSGQLAFALANFCVAASAAAFLIFNFHPARIFMGDAGSVPLGFLAGALGLVGWRDGLWPLWFPVAVFAPFVVDASVTLARRVLRRERVWEAHRSHYYQRLVLLGWSHRRTAFAEYALMIASGAGALLASRQSSWLQALLLALFACAYLLVMAVVDRRWRRGRLT